MAHGLIALNAPITGKELSRLLGGLQGTNRVHGIQIGALFVEFPIPSLEMNEVLRDLSGSSRKDASNALMQAQATRRPGTPPYPSGTRFNWPE
jgi:hypothetical protein